MAIMQKRLVALDINHGYKRYLFGQIFKMVEIKKRIHFSKHENVLKELNNYFDNLYTKFNWSETEYPDLIKKLKNLANSIIEAEEEKETEELALINSQANFFMKIAI